MTIGSAPFQRQFEGRALLERLLQGAGCVFSVREVEAHFRRAQADGESASQVIPRLFNQEPRFSDPATAQRMFQNLLGFWDSLQPNHDYFASGCFDAVDARYSALSLKEGQRALHSFENTQDALLNDLGEQEWSDLALSVAHAVALILFIGIQEGTPAGLRSVSWKLSPEMPNLPQSMLDYIEQRIDLNSSSSSLVLSSQEAIKVKQWLCKCARALWNARRST